MCSKLFVGLLLGDMSQIQGPNQQDRVHDSRSSPGPYARVGRRRRHANETDSMTAVELDSDGSPFMEMGKDGKPVDLTWRVTRVARGSGTSVREVEELLCQYRMMANMAKQAGGKNGWCALPTCGPP